MLVMFSANFLIAVCSQLTGLRKQTLSQLINNYRNPLSNQKHKLIILFFYKMVNILTTLDFAEGDVAIVSLSALRN